MQMHNTDVAVIGAGPAGSTAAMNIANHGYRVSLIEKDLYPGQTSVCAGGLAGISIKTLNLTSEVVEKRVSRWICYFPWQTYVLTNPSVSFQRGAFNRFLAEKAKERGAELLTSTLARNITRNRDGIVVSLKDRITGQNFTVKAKLVIFADGPNTLASKKFKNLGFRGRPSNTAFAAIYEIEWEDNPFDCFAFFFDRNVSPWGYGWIFPKRNVLNVGVASLMSKMRGNIRTCLDYLVNKHPVASRKLRGKTKTRFAADIIPLEHAKKISGNRVLVVGDSAGMVDPIWGAGIDYALRAGALAAKAIVNALEENEYEATLREGFEKKWKMGDAYRQMKRWQWFLRLALICSRLDKEAYFRLLALLMIKSRAQKVPQSICF